MDWQRFFAYKLSFITQSAFDQDWTCFLGHTGKCFNLRFIYCYQRHVWPVKILMVELSDSNEVINVFHDINLFLHMVISTHTMIWCFLKMINVFRSVSLILFIVTSIHNIQKRQAISRNLKTRWKLTEDSRLNVERKMLSKKEIY